MQATAAAIIETVTGRAVPVRGNDIDTDRIIPARYLRTVTFDGIGEHAFEDDRRGLKAKGEVHPFDKPEYQGGKILFVNKNFGCGSSREHAPQSLMRWGIEAVVGESFAEIFFGNCVSLGIPCVTVDEATIEKLMRIGEEFTNLKWTLDLNASELRSENLEAERKTSGAITLSDGQIFPAKAVTSPFSFSVPVDMPEGPRAQFLSGKWNPMSELLSNLPKVEDVAHNLPYVSGRW